LNATQISDRGKRRWKVASAFHPFGLASCNGSGDISSSKMSSSSSSISGETCGGAKREQGDIIGAVAGIATVLAAKAFSAHFQAFLTEN